MATIKRYLLGSALIAVLLILSTLHQRAAATFMPTACALFACLVAKAFALRHPAGLAPLGAVAGIAGLYLASLIPIASTVQEPVFLTNMEYNELIRLQRIEFVVFGGLALVTGSAIGFLCARRFRKV